FTGMPAAGAGAVDFDIEACPLGLGAQRRLSERRATDIAHADEQDGDGHSRPALQCLVAKGQGSASQRQREAQREGVWRRTWRLPLRLLPRPVSALMPGT